MLDDPDHSTDEDRFALLGLSALLRILVVAHWYREGERVVRFISATLPSLAKTFDAIQAKQQREAPVRGRDLTASMNSLLHAKPDSAPWNFVQIDETRVGHAVSKILNRPDLCDDLCANVIPWLVVVQGMMAGYFPGKLNGRVLDEWRRPR